MTRKLLVRDSHGERELLLIGTMAVGRDPRCDISDADPRLSRKHAEFIAARTEVRVRNLASRNGIQVNGAYVNETVLRPGDVVRMAHLTIRYVEEEPTRAPEPERTGGGDTDKTLPVPPRVAAAMPGRTSPPLPMAAAPLPATPADVEDDEATRFVPPPVAPAETVVIAARPQRDRGGFRAAEPAAGAAPMQPQTRPRAASARVPRMSWTTRVTLRVLVLAVGVFAVAALPLWIWQQRLASRYAASRAVTLARWLAADAAAADESGVIGEAASGVGKEPGVVSALVVSREGRVLAPPHRATESYERLPAFDVAPSDVRLARTTWNGGFVESVVPVISRRSGHTAVAWVTVHPAALPEARTGAVVILAPAFLVALIGAFALALGVRRATMRALAALNQDIELALSGHVESVTDPLGARPMRDLTDTVNYLLARLRGGGETDPLRQTPASGVPPTNVHAASEHRDARIVTDAAFRITEASAGCLELLGLKPSALVGHHLLDAVAEGAAADAVFRCLANLGSAGEMTAPVAHLGLDVTVARSVNEGPVTITFTKHESVVRV